MKKIEPGIVIKIPDMKVYMDSKQDDEWILTSEMVYFSPVFGEIRIEPGFVSDLASIPSIAQPVFKVNGRSRLAAVLHDKLYETKGKMPSRNFTRAESDYLFLEAMTGLGVKFIKRNLMYAAVKAGGWTYWNN